MWPWNAETIPSERRVEPVAAERGVPTPGNAAMPTIPTRAETRTAAPSPTKRLRGSVLPGSLRLLRQVRDGLEARVGEHRHRQDERERVPGRRDARGALRGAGPRRAEQEDEAEDEQQHRRDERDDGHDDRDPVEAGPADQPQDGDPEDDEDGGDDVPRVLRDPDPSRPRGRSSGGRRARRARSRSSSRGAAPSRSGSRSGR